MKISEETYHNRLLIASAIWLIVTLTLMHVR